MNEIGYTVFSVTLNTHSTNHGVGMGWWGSCMFISSALHRSVEIFVGIKLSKRKRVYRSVQKLHRDLSHHIRHYYN